jgi:5-methylcytosine-specific restriction endonuclease McrA
VQDRDGCVCQACGVNAREAQKWWSRIRRARKALKLNRDAGSGVRDNVMEEALSRLGWPVMKQEFWEADHIIARAEGGPDHPDNLRTLCVPCHKARTAEQRRQWAEQKRAEQATLFTAMEPG